jgi:hypothetical protein
VKLHAVRGHLAACEPGWQTAITYPLVAEPSFDVPGFMLKRLFRRDSAQIIQRLKREIAARSLSPEDLMPRSSK